MRTLKNYSEKEIVRLIQEHWITEDDLWESGICPVCFNQTHNNVLYGEDMLLYEDADFVCFFEEEPRADGHVVIYPKEHYSDLSEIDSEVGQKILNFAQKMILLLKKVYQAESVYLCSINDGEVSHFQLQMIPRYHSEKRGTYNFIKHRKPYTKNREKEEELQLLLSQDR